MRHLKYVGFDHQFPSRAPPQIAWIALEFESTNFNAMLIQISHRLHISMPKVCVTCYNYDEFDFFGRELAKTGSNAPLGTANSLSGWA
jgi:hypothetical protein